MENKLLNEALDIGSQKFDEITIIQYDSCEYKIDVNLKEIEIICEDEQTNFTIRCIKNHQESIINCKKNDLINILKSGNHKWSEYDEKIETNPTSSEKVEHHTGKCLSEKKEGFTEMIPIVQEIIAEYPEITPGEINFSYSKCNKQVGNNYGFQMHNCQESTGLCIDLIAQEGKNKTEKGDFIYLDDHSDVENFTAQLVKDTLFSLNPIEISSGNYDIVIKNQVFSSFLSMFLGQSLFGKTIINGSSCLAKKLNEQIFAENFNLIEKPMFGYMTYLYDDEAHKLEDSFIIENGVLKRFILNNLNAKKLNLKPTNNGYGFSESVSNIQLIGNSTYKDDDCVIIESLLSPNYNASTGLFSTSIKGTYKNKPFDNAVWHGNIFEIMQSAEFFQDYYMESNFITPSVKVNGAISSQ